MSKVTKKDAAIFAAFQKEIDKRLQEDIDGVYVTASE